MAKTTGTESAFQAKASFSHRSAKPIDPEGVIGINLKMAAPLHYRLRVRCVQAGLTLNEAIAEAVENWLKES